MEKWKRFIAALAIGTAVFGIAACDSDDGPDVEIEGEPGNPTEDPDTGLDPTLPDG